MPTEFHLVLTDNGEYLVAYSTVIDEAVAATKLGSVLAMVYTAPVTAVYRGRVIDGVVEYEMPVIRIDTKYGEAYPDTKKIRVEVLDGVDFIKKMVCEERLPVIAGAPKLPTKIEIPLWNEVSKVLSKWRKAYCSSS